MVPKSRKRIRLFLIGTNTIIRSNWQWQAIGESKSFPFEEIK